jgi:glutamine synthetase
MRYSEGMLTVEQLRTLVGSGSVDTVALALPDMQGRLQGKRLSVRYFLDEVLAHGAEACSYLLAVDVDMNTVDGYEVSSWDRGYGDFVLRPDLSTLRRVPWQPGTVLLLADACQYDGSPVPPAPRWVLRRQRDRLAARGLSAFAGTELEFIVFLDSYESAWRDGYRDLTPANDYNVDYSLVGTARIEPLLRRIRNSMTGAGLYVESAKGECNRGQHEIAFRFAEAQTTCDNHVIYKTGAKEIAAAEGVSLTFMAKYDQREGNSCHIHLSLRSASGEDGTDADSEDRTGPGGEPVLAGDRPHGFSRLMEHFLAGQLACLRELTLMFAPNINSYKRFQAGSFAPTVVAWGLDNRTCALRVVGHGEGMRVENRMPGGDVNPYLAIAAMIAAGLYGLDRKLELEPAYQGNAYQSDKPRVPTTLSEASRLFADSEVARAAFGNDVVEHYLNAARVEIEAFESSVTDWERYRGFERL